MTEPSYVEDAKWIADTLRRIERDSKEHRENMVSKIDSFQNDISKKLDNWKSGTDTMERNFHARLSVLEESKSLRYSALVGAGGVLGVALGWLTKILLGI